MKKELIGEFFATFILILFGCGSVGLAIISGFLSELWQVAAFWGAGVTLGIMATRKWSHSHMNPSVTLAMAFSGALSLKKVIPYWVVQLFGAFTSAGIVFLLFSKGIEQHEELHNMVRGSKESYVIASMFGEFFPNPGYVDTLSVSHLSAFLIEVVATFILLVAIYLFDLIPNLHKNLKAIIIGFTVSVLIIIVAPYTQACFNPARDFGPRLIAYFAGWGRAAFPSIYVSAFTVYVFAPLIGASAAGLLFRKRD